MRLSIILFLVFISVADCFCQNRNNIWCFGDSAGIDFSNISNPTPFHTAVKSRGSCVSICDTNSNLLFYAYTRATIPGNTTLVKNRFDSLMVNGDNIVGRGWYMELIIIPFPDDTNKYYLFSVGVTTIYGLYYSIIDMSLDSGRGAVTQKNIQLLSDPANDYVAAIKHGNGRDWWILFRNDGYYAGGPNNKFYKFLITPNGITPTPSQNIGNSLNSGFQRLIFNKSGDKLAFSSMEGLIETYNFDRCTGMLSNHLIISPLSSPNPRFFSCALSPNDRFLYVCSNKATASYLIQIDLQSSNPWQNCDTLWTDSSFAFMGGNLRLAPDDKIYLTCAWNSSLVQNFPYPDTVYVPQITHLSVINSPDSLGTACNFTPFSFYLGGGRSHWGLPNNPNYDMQRLQGSACDTVQWTSVQNIEQAKGLMYVSYITDWQKLFVNAQGLKGKSFKISVYDMVGNVIYTEEGASTSLSMTHSGYFTKDINMAAFAKGMYIVNFVTDKERLAKKFIKD